MRDTKKMARIKIVCFNKIYKFTIDYFFIGVLSFFLLVKNVSMKIKYSIFSEKYTRYGKNVKK